MERIMNKVDLNKYAEFVLAICSNQSKDAEAFVEHVRKLHNNTNVNIPLLLTSGIGLASEGGEFNEIVKKIFFQGKPLDEDNIFHMKRELGDIMWYWMNACNALGLDPNAVIAENVKKLEARYPGGSFDAFYSENRKDGDL
jgi:NTP pyrophosphatase (non-canonical NTP hydrolase)